MGSSIMEGDRCAGPRSEAAAPAGPGVRAGRAGWGRGGGVEGQRLGREDGELYVGRRQMCRASFCGSSACGAGVRAGRAGWGRGGGLGVKKETKMWRYLEAL